MVRAQMLLGLIVAALPTAHAHAAVRSDRAFLGANMQPEVVAHTLQKVEEEWKAQAALFVECKSNAKDGASIVDCQDAPASFAKSCGIVVGALVQSSNGDKHVTNEYMADVCGQTSLMGWHKKQCLGLAQAVNGAMTADAYNNRYNFDSKKLCAGFWSEFQKTEQKRMEEEKAAREAAEKKAAEEERIARELAEKRAQEEAAEAARKAEEERKAEDARKKIEEAARKKAEAEAKAKAAAEKAAKKRAEAEAEAKAAQQKMDEARQAEKEHKEAAAKLAAKANTPVEKKAVTHVAAKPVAKPAAVVVAAKPEAAPAKPEAKTAAAHSEKAAPAVEKTAAKQTKSEEKPAAVAVAGKAK